MSVLFGEYWWRDARYLENREVAHGNGSQVRVRSTDMTANQ
jgi:hypothetical protein